jgi:hypothetical protein
MGKKKTISNSHRKVKKRSFVSFVAWYLMNMLEDLTALNDIGAEKAVKYEDFWVMKI